MAEESGEHSARILESFYCNLGERNERAVKLCPNFHSAYEECKVLRLLQQGHAYPGESTSKHLEPNRDFRLFGNPRGLYICHSLAQENPGAE